MRPSELIKLLPTQFKRISNASSLYVGHNIPLIGYWTKEEGYKQLQSLKDDSIDESLPCPIIAIVTKKFGGKDVTLTLTGKTSIYKRTSERKKGDYLVTKKIYKPTETTITSTLKIPRHTRPWAMFLISGLGQDVYELTTVTDNVEFDVGKVEFYALASPGSKIIYWFVFFSILQYIDFFFKFFDVAKNT